MTGETIRLFVGCAPDGADAESMAVLEYTARKHCSLPIEITWMHLSRDPGSVFYSDGRGRGWNTENWATPFSGFRWAVPALCGYLGRAIYCDSDFLFCGDLAELWRQAFAPGAVAMIKAGSLGRFCLTYWDCFKAAAVLPGFATIQAHNRGMRGRLAGSVQAFEGDWNCFDGFGYGRLTDPALKAIHYTDMRSQPHLDLALARLAARGRAHWYDGPRQAHPRADLVALFDRLLIEAADAGYRPETYEPAETYGPVRKARLTGYRGNRASP